MFLSTISSRHKTERRMMVTSSFPQNLYNQCTFPLMKMCPQQSMYSSPRDWPILNRRIRGWRWRQHRNSTVQNTGKDAKSTSLCCSMTCPYSLILPIQNPSLQLAFWKSDQLAYLCSGRKSMAKDQCWILLKIPTFIFQPSVTWDLVTSGLHSQPIKTPA